MEKLTIEEALQEVESIKQVICDDEAAHSLEDALYCRFVKCVSEGVYTQDEVIQVAKIVRSTQDLKFNRWRA
jgi:phosphosulfolactate phosphohydrolase-like enzyme